MSDKTLILGDGLLGSWFEKQTGWSVISRKKDGFDITASSCISSLLECHHGVAWSCPWDTIINTIAYTNTYDKDRQQHWDVNYAGVVRLADFCERWSVKLIQIVTDYIYTNATPNASEDDIPIHGDNWYSYTKLLADAYVQLKYQKHLIIRATHKEHPFSYNKAWVNQVGNFDYLHKIGGLSLQLINQGSQGVFNVGTELKSMLELAKQSSVQVQGALAGNEVPSNVSMSIEKMKNELTR